MPIAAAQPDLLAARPLKSLSPGERLRAALLCLCSRRPPVELLVLDEPSDHLDFVGAAALRDVLAGWPGGLLLVTHDPEPMRHVGIERRIAIGGASTSQLRVG